MAIDDSFKQAGAVPFKWEIRPGVPKLDKNQEGRLCLLQHHEQHHAYPPPIVASPQKLKPPPAGFNFHPPLESRTPSFRSSPRTRSERWRFHQPSILGRPECALPGCFLSPLLRRKKKKKKGESQLPETESEPDYTSKLETLSRWSVSSRKSFSPFVGSPASSFSSFRSSPRPISDAEWAALALF